MTWTTEIKPHPEITLLDWFAMSATENDVNNYRQDENGVVRKSAFARYAFAREMLRMRAETTAALKPNE